MAANAELHYTVIILSGGKLSRGDNSLSRYSGRGSMGEGERESGGEGGRVSEGVTERVIVAGWVI